MEIVEKDQARTDLVKLIEWALGQLKLIDESALENNACTPDKSKVMSHLH